MNMMNKALEVVRDALSIENKQAGAFNFKSILRDWENEKRGEWDVDLCKASEIARWQVFLPV